MFVVCLFGLRRNFTLSNVFFVLNNSSDVTDVFFQCLQQASSEFQNLDLKKMTVEEFLQTAKAITSQDIRDLSKPGLSSALPRLPRHHKKLTRCSVRSHSIASAEDEVILFV